MGVCNLRGPKRQTFFGTCWLIEKEINITVTVDCSCTLHPQVQQPSKGYLSSPSLRTTQNQKKCDPSTPCSWTPEGMTGGAGRGPWGSLIWTAHAMQNKGKCVKNRGGHLDAIWTRVQAAGHLLGGGYKSNHHPNITPYAPQSGSLILSYIIHLGLRVQRVDGPPK